MVSVKPEVARSSFVIGISTGFQILSTLSTLATPIGVLRTSKIVSTKPELIITSLLIGIYAKFLLCVYD